MNRPYAKLTITKKGERAARSGHPWVYGEEVTHVEGTYQTGDIVDVYSDKDRYLGTGFANDISKIRVRIVSRNALTRGYGSSGLVGSSALDRPLWPPANQGSS